MVTVVGSAVDAAVVMEETVFLQNPPKGLTTERRVQEQRGKLCVGCETRHNPAVANTNQVSHIDMPHAAGHAPVAQWRHPSVATAAVAWSVSLSGQRDGGSDGCTHCTSHCTWGVLTVACWQSIIVMPGMPHSCAVTGSSLKPVAAGGTGGKRVRGWGDGCSGTGSGNGSGGQLGTGSVRIMDGESGEGVWCGTEDGSFVDCGRTASRTHASVRTAATWRCVYWTATKSNLSAHARSHAQPCGRSPVCVRACVNLLMSAPRHVARVGTLACMRSCACVRVCVCLPCQVALACNLPRADVRPCASTALAKQKKFGCALPFSVPFTSTAAL